MSAGGKIAEKLSECRWWEMDTVETADAILAAMPDMIPDLVWDMQSHVSGTAATPFGEYLVETCHEEGFGFWCPSDYKEDEPPFGYYQTIDETKAAANAHHKAQLAKAMGWTE